MNKKALSQNVYAPQRIDKMAGTYDGKELKRNPGITDARFEAFKLPSRMGDTLVYPKSKS
jgi:hypothetical protein